tara:strand:+ start:43 stop:150 length:108 start_codon:yes stop_codon:yes gene_type:complete
MEEMERSAKTANLISQKLYKIIEALISAKKVKVSF